MLRGAIVSPDPELGERLEEVLAGMGIVSIVRTLDRYPNPQELLRMLRANAPQIIFLSVESVNKALEVVTVIDTHTPGVQVVAIDQSCDPQTLLEVMRGGIREFLAMPFHRQNVYDALVRVQEQLERRPPALDSSELVYAFLPAKAGVGATTIAANAAAAISRIPEQRSLLLDLDLNSGMLRFLFQLENTYSIIDAAGRAHNMDEHIWPQLVSRVANLDVVHAGPLNPEARLETSQLRHLLDFARRNYESILLDLSGNLERFSLELMHESRRIFLVVTPEVPSLHLARERIGYLRGIELGDRVSVLLNRCQKRSVVSPSQVEELLGLPVLMSFSNDYQGVHKALTLGKPVDPGSELGRQFGSLAQVMLDRKRTAPEPAGSRKKFTEYLALLPSRPALTESKKPV